MTDFKFEAWPTEFRTINQYFGVNPENYAQFGLPGHEGLDFMAPDGSKVFCVAPGTVFAIHPEPTGHNYGTHVRVNHIDSYQTTYGHMRQLFVQVGQVVKTGDVLGLADNTGNSFGSHLHLTLKKLDANYLNWPFNITDPTPFVLPLLGFQTPAGPYVDGWAFAASVTLGNGLAQANAGGINLRTDASQTANIIVLVPAGTIMIVTGTGRNGYLPVKVSRAAVGLPDVTPTPTPPPAPAGAIDGYGFATALTISGSQGVVTPVGINLRAQASRTAPQIGLVKGGSTVTILGGQQGEYFPVRARQEDFQGAVTVPPAPIPPPAPPPTPGPAPLPAGTVLGWAFTQNMTVSGQQAVVGTAGINLRAAADQNAAKLGVVNEGAAVTIVGPARGVYLPIWARTSDITGLVSPLPPVVQPDPFPAAPPPAPPAVPPPAPPNSTPGWAFTTQMTINGQSGLAGTYGLRLRNGPRRDATEVGFIPANTTIAVTGPAQGEYTPVRVDNANLQPPFGTTPAATAPASADPPALGNCRIGLHASADPGISDAEIEEFLKLRPGIIKVLSLHSDTAIRRLATSIPDASWIVRAFLDFGGRTIGPEQFVNDTLSDTKRALGALAGRDVVVELHNEPNVNAEGLGKSWTDGASFATWWLDVLGRYRAALPGVRFIYPGLSPGTTVTGIKLDHTQFAEASRAAIEAADGLGIHIYWSAVYPLSAALGVVDDFISRFRFKLLWITEASNNKGGTSVPDKAQQYLQCWQALQQRATVQGVTFFVASASNPDFAEEIWVGRGLGALVGAR
jgi:Peptidase family M23